MQLYEACGLLLIALAGRVVLARVETATTSRGSAFRFYLIAYGVLRLLLDPLRGDGRPERWLGLSHQQGIALALIVLASVAPLLHLPRAAGETERG